MIIKTHAPIAGVVYATMRREGVAGGYIARGKTSAEAIENVLLVAMNSAQV